MIEPRIPDLFLLGAMKSGTTYLSKLLEAHPSIFVCRPEEPNYFVNPEVLEKNWPYMWRQGFWRSREEYLRLFEQAGNAKIRMEASTNYTKYPLFKNVAMRINGFNPNAKFIYIMRDPIERTMSHYWHQVIFNSEHRSILAAIKSDTHYIDVSNYCMQISEYLKYFDRNQFHFLTYEDLIANPLVSMQRIYEWLGVEASQVDLTVANQPENVAPKTVRRPIAFGVFHKFRQLRPVRNAVSALPSAVRQFAKRAVTVEVARAAIDTTAVIAYLRPIQLEHTGRLERLLGREFSEWTTLHGILKPRNPGRREGVLAAISEDDSYK